MNLFSQLVVGTVTAIAATFVAHHFHLSAPLQLGALIIAATWISPILNKIMLARARGAAARPKSAAKPKAKAKAKPKPTAKPESQPRAKSDAPREEGEVKWFNVSKGFGFIRRDNDEEIFVHFRSIIDIDGSRRGLKDGQRVSYVVVESDKGPQAEEVEGL